MNRNAKMQGISLNRAAIREANSTDCGPRAIIHKGIRGLRARKASSLERTTCRGLLWVTVWLLLVPTRGVSQASSSPINLLSPKNGGQVIVATSDDWLKTIDGSESAKEFPWEEWAIYAFKDERPATFDTFAVLIPGQGPNLRQFELLAGNDSATGKFDSIGKFTTTNAKFIKSPYQEFKFPPVTAKYLKVQLISGWRDYTPANIYQFRLFGLLKE